LFFIHLALASQTPSAKLHFSLVLNKYTARAAWATLLLKVGGDAEWPYQPRGGVTVGRGGMIERVEGIVDHGLGEIWLNINRRVGSPFVEVVACL